MPNVPYQAMTSNTTGQGYDKTWASIFSIEFEPQVWRDWYQAYGNGTTIFDMLQIIGQTVSVKSDTITSRTDVALERPLLLGAAIATSGHTAGAAREFKIAAAEWLSGTTEVTPHVQVGESLLIDPAYTNKDVPTKWQITSIGTYNSGTPTVGSIKPWDSTVVLTANVPDASYVAVTGYNSGRKGGQPGAKSAGTTSDTFYTAITATSGELTGGINALETYRKTRDKSGKNVVFNKMQVEAEFLHNAGMDKELLLGEVNSNSLTSTAKGSSTTTTKGTKGYIHHLDDDGMELEYSSAFSIDHFDAIKDYLRSQAVTDGEVAFLQGSGLGRNVENNVLGFIKEYSGGSDLTNGMSAVGMPIKSFLKNGIVSHMVPLDSFDNPNSYGVMDDYFKNFGAVIPMSQATVQSDGIMESNGKKVKIPNLAIGYLKNNNEDRERMIGFESGVNGFTMPFMNEWDSIDFYIKSEYMLVANLVNQHLKIHKDGTY